MLEAINGSGRAYLSHTLLPLPMEGGGNHNAFVLRMAIGSARTEERHVREAWELIRNLASPA